jgi:hypothetical protein
VCPQLLPEKATSPGPLLDAVRTVDAAHRTLVGRIYDGGMKRRADVLLLRMLLGIAFTVSCANGEVSPPVQAKAERLSPMSQDSVMIDLFNRWERVWNEGKFDLVQSCVSDAYIRHDPKGERTVTRDAYAAEVASIHKDRPDIRVICLRSLVLRRSRLVSFCIQVDGYQDR